MATPSTSTVASPSSASGRRVAIVGGTDDAATQAVASFLTQLGLEAAPLGPPAVSDDTTFLDRLEGARGADYAIVLQPASDLAPSAGAAGLRAETLMEIGFLFGLLSRQRVCFLVTGKAALAPELDGLLQVHTRDDADLWHLLVAREMRKAGLDVDMNKAV